jgi:hypothetical protein
VALVSSDRQVLLPTHLQQNTTPHAQLARLSERKRTDLESVFVAKEGVSAAYRSSGIAVFWCTLWIERSVSCSCAAAHPAT